MTEYRTIYGKVVAYEAVREALLRYGRPVIGSVGEAGRWNELVVRGDRSTVTFNAKVRTMPGDEFSRLIVSTHSFASRLVAVGEAPRETVLSKIARAQMAIGVVAEPGFDPEEPQMAWVYAVAEAVEGVVFDGRCFFSSDGIELLRMDGV